MAAGVVAVMFAPARDWLQRRFGRLVYGDRDDPYAVISRLAKRLDGALPPESVLTTVVRTIREALRLQQARIELTGTDGRDLAMVQDPPTGVREATMLDLPLVYRGEPVGTLSVAPRTPGEAFTAGDRRLLDDLARHAGAAAYAARAAADLQQARERLVTARQEERRRLRRDLHDGLGPSMAALTMKLDAAQTLADSYPAKAKLLVAEVHSEMGELVSAIRGLVYGLWPPALDQLGLAEALLDHAQRQLTAAGSSVVCEFPEKIDGLPAATEFAAYFIAVEAITNVQRHAAAPHCWIVLRRTSTDLELEVADDGRGIPPDQRHGVGVPSMKERASEMGGACTIEPRHPVGTIVRARLPIKAVSGD